jgi:1-deoxy-D-xylulose-5-phosphate reductoisomerase|tara:strand:+ start:1174 stop:2340 length:1167 start_codon:yes stop_codon:yes gene_type:complete
MKKNIAIFGSTGSIGKTLCDIIQKDKNNFCVKLLTSHKNTKILLKQIKVFNVKNIIVTDKKSFFKLKKFFKYTNLNIYNDFSELKKIFKHRKIDYLMNSISGLEGLEPTLNVIKYCKSIAIANKESIICGWNLIEKELQKYNTKFIPIDSEHFSIMSLLDNTQIKDVESIFITASGGPFLNYPLSRFKLITPKLALNHPNWKMGKKISVDSSTMMNKVFEIIEARKIFNIDYKKLNILIHSKSYVHAVIKFSNGLTKILVHDTNMTIPIFNSIYNDFQKKIISKKFDTNKMNDLDFQKVDYKKFPVVKLISILPYKHSLFETVLVSANDALVNKFLNNEIKFIDISKKLIKIVKTKEFSKYKYIRPKNVGEIIKLQKYVISKTNLMCI